MHHPTLARHCLHAFSQQVPSACAAFYRIDERLQACDFQLHGMQAPMHHSYLQHYRHLDPLQPRTCLATGMAVIPLREGLALHDPGENRQYQRFLRQHQVVDVVEVIAKVAERPVAGLSLIRRDGQAPFSRQELQRLQPLLGLLQLALQGSAPEPASRLDGLTARERQIALLLRDGTANKAIARTLGIGLPTVKTHLLNLLRKSGAGNRTELVARLFL
ncbi:helix-turn-helix transcriptional regulator [Pseudomonas sp. ABC1]|uniref:helix-turn-helix transcriptional regulator n=1 Tax=Pseudomonas sp. ABC1 TaxID=2748080 RepID=UPI0015C2D71D|nr:helix-turn-helix transcriptional regulator [Pseudomonas sp. ABC1]QLF93391.1 helix-turn-helix transcriptional regulator [Pseudomonas sp. ABC1]